MSPTPLKVLIVEDVPHDAELLVRELRKGGFEVTFERVDTAEAMGLSLRERAWDLVVSDYSLPRFSGPAALALVKEHRLDVPFIIVSGTVGEEVAVESIRLGAHDFMAKGQYARLVPAVKRELRDAGLRAERHRMQEQLLISERMASMGTLAAGVAHEINNPLAALMANLECVRGDLEAVAQGLGTQAVPETVKGLVKRLEESFEPLRDAQECALRVRNIVRDLKIFSRSEDGLVDAVDVRQVLESSLRMAWNEVRHRARLVKDFGEVPHVRGNEARLGQVFLNLVLAAARSMPDGRAHENTLRVSTRQERPGQVVVEVCDTGGGLEEPVRARIFEPFTATQVPGGGTGLALAICHRIVVALGGEIRVDSEAGKGTCYRVDLPVAADPIAEPAAAASGTLELRRGRILVVDDEPSLGAAVSRLLALDHEVLVVTSARAAAALIERGERFDVILCDVMMPEVTGIDLHAMLSQLSPEHAQRMVFMTGGAFTARARDFLERTTNPRIDKPFDGGSLRAVVGRFLT
ncbi:MAG: response regulator [Myxococcaceae bacterium]|nr:response regulator [Myxococcaceae bacterium]